MAKAPKAKAQSQRERFIEAARKAGADEDEANFERQLRAIAGRNSIPGAVTKKPAKTRKK